MNLNWQNDERFQKIGWEKRTFLINWMKEHGPGNNNMQLMSLVMSLNQAIKQKNLDFTAQENELLNELFFDSMTPAEKQRFQMLQALMKKGNS